MTALVYMLIVAGSLDGTPSPKAEALTAAKQPVSSKRHWATKIEPTTWTALGIGSAGLVTASIYGFMMRSTQSGFDAAPATTVADLRALRQLKRRGDRRARNANIAWAVGGGVMATGVALLLWDLLDEPTSPVVHVHAADGQAHLGLFTRW